MSLSDGLIVDLPLKTDGLDISGNGLSLTTISGASFSNNFLNFDGINDYAVRDLEPAHKVASMTMSSVINLKSIPPSIGWVTTLSPRNLETGRGVGLYVLASGVANARIGTGGAATQLPSTTIIAPATEYDIVWSFDSGTLKIYVNGIEENTVGGVSPIDWADNGNDPEPAAFYVGARKTNTTTGNQIADTGFVNGAVRLVKQWNRALTPAEVLENYENSLLPDNSFKTTQLVTRF